MPFQKSVGERQGFLWKSVAIELDLEETKLGKCMLRMTKTAKWDAMKY